MQKYTDKQNTAGLKILFMFVQMVVLSVVYIITYTSFKAVAFAIEEQGASVWMYIPVLVALVVFPVLLYGHRKMFNAGKMMLAVIWTMATASLTIVLLYAYIVQITS